MNFIHLLSSRYLQVNRHNVDFKQLFAYSQNIVDGMEYLTHNKIIHRYNVHLDLLLADGRNKLMGGI